MKDTVLTDKAPKPIGPYSQGVKVNGFLYLSGQVALDPRSNEFTGWFRDCERPRSPRNSEPR